MTISAFSNCPKSTNIVGPQTIEARSLSESLTLLIKSVKFKIFFPLKKTYDYNLQFIHDYGNSLKCFNR